MTAVAISVRREQDEADRAPLVDAVDPALARALGRRPRQALTALAIELDLLREGLLDLGDALTHPHGRKTRYHRGGAHKPARRATVRADGRDRGPAAGSAVADGHDPAQQRSQVGGAVRADRDARVVVVVHLAGARELAPDALARAEVERRPVPGLGARGSPADGCRCRRGRSPATAWARPSVLGRWCWSTPCGSRCRRRARRRARSRAWSARPPGGRTGPGSRSCSRRSASGSPR